MKARLAHGFATAALGLCLLVSNAAFAGPATDLVKGTQTALFDALTTTDAASDKKVAALFDEMLDYGALAEGSLGTEWAPRSDAEKAQFSGLLKQLVQKAYKKNLRKTLGYGIEYLTEEAAGGAVIVKTRAKSLTKDGEEPIAIDFKMVQRGGTWKVVDIVTEGVSLVTSYRAQFTKVIKKDGFPALITKMKDKIAKGDV